MAQKQYQQFKKFDNLPPKEFCSNLFPPTVRHKKVQTRDIYVDDIPVVVVCTCNSATLRQNFGKVRVQCYFGLEQICVTPST